MLPYVYARLPHAGLGNMLFVWAKAYIFAKEKKVPLITSSWSKFRPRHWFKYLDKRLYWNTFKSSSMVDILRCELALAIKQNVIIEPCIKNQQRFETAVFSQVPHWRDYFKDIKPFRKDILSGFSGLLTPDVKLKLNQLEKPCIGIHIRCGDFSQPNPNISFSRQGLVRTPLHYFIDTIHQIRSIANATLPVTVFSNGTDHEINHVLSLPKVQRAKPQVDVLDLLQMAQSQILILSASSTFGMWAGFLGEMPILHHPDHFHATIRPPEIQEHIFEGILTNTKISNTLIENILKIH